MATKVASAFVEIGGNNTGALKAMNQVNSGLDNTGKKAANFKTIAAGVFTGFVGANVAMSALNAVGGAISDSIKLASDLNETMSKTKVIFDDAANVIIDKSDDMASAAGLSQQAFLDSAATFGVFGKSAGLAGADLAGFSTDLSILAADMASFSNTTPEEAITALAAALRGESEPIRRYGVLLDDASLRQKALELGIINTTKNALTPQQRVLAAQKLIFEQTSDAQGDFARTSDGLANQQRILKAETENLKVELGEKLLPTAINVTSAFVDFIQALDGTYDATEHAKDGVSGLDKFMRGWSNAVWGLNRSIYILHFGLDDLFGGSHDFNEWVKDEAYNTNKATHELNEYNLETRKYGNIVNTGAVPAAKKLDTATQVYRTTVADEIDAKRVEYWAFVQSTAATREAQKAIEHTTGAYADYIDAMGGSIDNEIRDFKESQSDINDEMQENADRIAELNGLSYLTSDQQKELDDLEQAQKDLQTEYGNNATEHEKSLRRILLDMAIEKLAAADLTTEERRRGEDMIQALMIKWGLLDQTTLSNITTAQDYADLINSGDFEDAKLVLEGSATKWDITQRNAQLAAGNAGAYANVVNGLDGKTVNVEIITKYTNIGNPNPVVSPGAPPDNSGKWKWDGQQWVPSGHSGLDFIVPPGHPNDSYPILAESGERVTITPAGQSGNQPSGGKGLVIENININTPAGANGFQLFQQFRQALEAELRAAGRGGISYADI